MDDPPAEAPGPSAPTRRRAGRALEVGIGLYAAVIFTILWVGFAVGVLTGGSLLVDAWAWLTALEPIAAVVAWILLLPIAVGLWAWNAAGSVLVIAVVGVGLVAWTLVAVSALLKTVGRRGRGCPGRRRGRRRAITDPGDQRRPAHRDDELRPGRAEGAGRRHLHPRRRAAE